MAQRHNLNFGDIQLDVGRKIFIPLSGIKIYV
jgi:hypothetical protein